MSLARLEMAYFASNITAELGEVQSDLGGLSSQVASSWALERERDRVADMAANELRGLYLGLYEVVGDLRRNVEEEKYLLARMDKGIQEAQYLEWYGSLTSPEAAMFFLGWAATARCGWFYWPVLTFVALICDGPTTMPMLLGTATHWLIVTLGESRLVRWMAGRRAAPPVLPMEVIPAEVAAGADQGAGWGLGLMGFSLAVVEKKIISTNLISCEE